MQIDMFIRVVLTGEDKNFKYVRPGRQKINGYGGSNHFLYITSDNRNLHHDPQDQSRYGRVLVPRHFRQVHAGGAT